MDLYAKCAKYQHFMVKDIFMRHLQNQKSLLYVRNAPLESMVINIKRILIKYLNDFTIMVVDFTIMRGYFTI